MNEENEWDHKTAAGVKEGPVQQTASGLLK